MFHLAPSVRDSARGERQARLALPFPTVAIMIYRFARGKIEEDQSVEAQRQNGEVWE
jgi:hypothetical protein